MPPIRRPSRHRSTSGHSYDDDFIERMAQRTAFYITTFDEHSKVVRGKRKEQVREAYNRVIEQGLVLPANTPRTSLSMQDLGSMEQKLRSLPKDTLDEYVPSYFIGQVN